MKSLKRYVRTAGRFKVQHAAASAALRRSRERVRLTRDIVAVVQEAQAIAQAAAKAVQDKVHRRIGDVTSKCLEMVFGDGAYSFRFVFEKKRGRTEARPAFFRGGYEYDPVGQVGGGVVDVAAFALRVCKVMLQRPAVMRVLFLDEPFTRPSKFRGYKERVRAMLEGVCEELDFQIIMVTQDMELACGKVIRL